MWIFPNRNKGASGCDKKIFMVGRGQDRIMTSLSFL